MRVRVRVRVGVRVRVRVRVRVTETTAAGRAASSEARVCCTVASADLVRGSGSG